VPALIKQVLLPSRGVRCQSSSKGEAKEAHSDIIDAVQVELYTLINIVFH
jgi:hypothetical protein